MRRLAVLLAAAVLLAGCGAVAAPPTGPSPAQSAAAGAPSAADTAAAVLDGFVCYGADTAGCSLKSAQAAAVLVEYLSRADISAETVTDGQGGLDELALLHRALGDCADEILARGTAEIESRF